MYASRRKYKLGLAVVLTSLVLVAFASMFYEGKPRVYTVSGIKPGDTREEVVKNLGPPSKTARTNEWMYETFSVLFSDDQVYQISGKMVEEDGVTAFTVGDNVSSLPGLPKVRYQNRIGLYTREQAILVMTDESTISNIILQENTSVPLRLYGSFRFWP